MLLVLSGVSGAQSAPIFERAFRAYQAGELEEAYSGFLDLAQLGHGDSQFNLGVMYLNGHGDAGRMVQYR